jgi:hypothetical protein
MAIQLESLNVFFAVKDIADSVKPSTLKDRFERIHHLVWIQLGILRRQMKLFLEHPIILLSKLLNAKTPIE